MVTLSPKHLALVHTVRRVHFASVPSAVVDGLISDGMLALLRAAQRYQTGRGAAFETYAVCCIRGAMQSRLRTDGGSQRSSINHHTGAWIDTRPPQLVGDWTETEVTQHPIEDWEQTDALWAALRQLSPRERRVITQIHLLGYSGREVAASLDTTPATISRVATAAREKLRLLLDREALAA